MSQKITEADTLKSSVERLQAELNAKSEELNNDRNKWTLQERDMNKALENSRQQETRLLEELEQYKNQLRAVEESKQAVQVEHASAMQRGHELANKCSQLEQQLEQLQAQSRVDAERWNNNKKIRTKRERKKRLAK